MTYINEQGGIWLLPLMTLAITLWKWCPQRELMIQAGIENTVVGFEPRRPFTINLWQPFHTFFEVEFRHCGALTTSNFLQTGQLICSQSTYLGRVIRGGGIDNRRLCTRLEPTRQLLCQSSMKINLALSGQDHSGSASAIDFR
ncbi:MAG: hypothetical protein EXX96DRAFT_554317 [Benjaminiella poitrasii]|nr:MAG: hypothetical protein EXX96DRAFT_554317 [Benjaminiella poitrasii]